jgi:hypothetical protein
LIGTELVQQKQFEAVVLVTIAIGGTSIAQWAPGGNLHAHLMSAMDAVGPACSYTHVFIQKGEADLLAHTTAEDYFRRFAEVIAALRRSGVEAPIFVAVETGYCDGRWTPPKPSNPIAEAQRRVIAAHDGLYFGANMDGRSTPHPIVTTVAICQEPGRESSPVYGPRRLPRRCPARGRVWNAVDPSSAPRALYTATPPVSWTRSEPPCRHGLDRRDRSPSDCRTS